MCAVPNMAVQCSSLISCFPSTLFGYFMTDFEMVPHALCFHCKVFFYILESTQLPSLTYLCLLKQHRLLPYMFLFNYHGLWWLLYCWGWLCQFALVYSTIWLPCFLDAFLLTLLHAHVSVLCLILPLFPFTCWSLVQHILYCLSFYALFLCQYCACWYNVIYCLIKLLT